LLTDAATPMIQVVVIDGGEIVANMSSLGNGIDSIAGFVKEVFSKMNLNFDDFNAMIYCDARFTFRIKGGASFHKYLESFWQKQF